MPASVMKKCVHDYITPLTYLVNSSIKQAIFPSELKIAKVFPIFKAGDEQLITNYRPGMILSNKEKNGKLCNTKNGRPAHVARAANPLRVSRGVWGHAPQENFCFQHGFLDF